MNSLDLIVLAIMAICMYAGYSKGLILTLFRLVSFFLSIFLTMRIYPFMSRCLMQTALYERLQEMVIQSMGLQSFFQEHVSVQASELIDSLPLPAMLRALLLTNNTPDMYAMLSVRTVEEYIGGFFASLAINVISMVLVFILVWFLLKLVGNMLNIIGRLPVIKTLNRAGGTAAGFVLGIVLVWAGLTVMSVLFATPAYPLAYELLHGSLVAAWFFDNNWMMGFVVRN